MYVVTKSKGLEQHLSSKPDHEWDINSELKSYSGPKEISVERAGTGVGQQPEAKWSFRSRGQHQRGALLALRRPRKFIA